MVMALAALESLALEDAVTVDTWSQQNAVIARYQSSVVAQGRALVCGEMEAMKLHLP